MGDLKLMKVRSVVCLVVAPMALAAFTHLTASAQSEAALYLPGINYNLPSVVVTAEDIATLKAKMLANKTLDVPMRMVDAGGHNVGVSLVYRLKGDGNAPVIHDKVSEVYQIIEGSGTLTTGGKIVDAKRRGESGGNGPGLAGTAMAGGVDRKVKTGDVIIIPAGTPHKWSSVEEFMLYTVVRVDPGRIVPLK